MHSRKSKKLLLGLGMVLAVSLIGFASFEVSKSRDFQFFGDLTARVETAEKIVALTFDDAPTEFTGEVLQILLEKNIRATFYVVGSALEKHPELAKRIVRDGHELGNHSYSHQRFLLKSQEFIDQEIQSTNRLIREAGYSGEITFRPPYGKKFIGLPWYLNQHGIKTVMWDVEPETYESDAAFLIAHTLDRTKPGSIILFHPFCDACENARTSLPVIIDQLKLRGYRFVTVSELLSIENV